jgi:hypothetical protein
MRALAELQKRQAGIPMFILRLSLKALFLFPESVSPLLIQELELPILEAMINVHQPEFVSTEQTSYFQYPQTKAHTALHLHITNSNGAISSRIFDWINMATERVEAAGR